MAEFNVADLTDQVKIADIADIDTVHDLHSTILAALKEVPYADPDRIALQELARRADRKLGQAIRRGQSVGTITSTGQTTVYAERHGLKPPVHYVSSKQLLPDLYLMADVSDELFEEALKRCSDTLMGRRPVAKAITDLKEAGWEPVVRKVRPTARGKRTIEDMAIKINAMRYGVEEMDPGEVDYTAHEEMVFQMFQDIGIIRSFLRKVKNQNG